MELYSINVNSPIEVEKELKFENITYENETFRVIIKDDGHINLKIGQTISFNRYIDRGDNEIAIYNYGEIVNKEDNVIWVTQPINDLIKIQNIEQITKDKIRIKLATNHNIFQQDIEFCQSQEIYFYDINRTLILSANTNNFGIPKLYDNAVLTKKDCIIENKKLESCGICKQGAIVYNYIFCPNNVSLDSILLNNISYEDLENIKFVSFKHSPLYFIKDDNSVSIYEDIWFDQIVAEDDDDICNTYINGKTRTTLSIYDAYYKIDLGLSTDSDYLSLGNEDSFGTYFAETLMDDLIPSVIDMERIKYVPAYKHENKINNAEKISFYLHFRERAKVPDNERITVNSVYTSGNVYYDTWHIDSDKKEYTWWNDYEVTNIVSREKFNVETFTNFNRVNGKKSDLIGYLNFTDNDIFFRKKKVSQSFLRLSFYTSTDPIEQKLLYYSTIFLDDGELYGKYLKQLQFLQNDKKYNINKKSNNSKVNNNAVVVMTPEGIRVDTKISVTNEFDKNKSSEGFNLYLFAQDQDFNFENGKKTIYMRVEFNHAGNGKTTPLIMWPKNEKGDFCPLTTENYIESLYIPVELQYIDNKYVYTFINGEVNNDEIELILYEPKLDMVEDAKDYASPNSIGVIHVSPEYIVYNRQFSEQNIIKVVSNTNWVIDSDDGVNFTKMSGTSGVTEIKISQQPSSEVNIVKFKTISNETYNAEGYAELEVRKSSKFKPYLRVSNDAITMLYIQDEAKIKVNSNTAWSIDFENNNNTGITISAYTENNESGQAITGDGYIKIFKVSGYSGDNFSFTISTNNDSEFDGTIDKDIYVTLSNEKPEPNNCMLIFENISDFKYKDGLTLYHPKGYITITGVEFLYEGIVTDLELNYGENISFKNTNSGIVYTIKVKDDINENIYTLNGNNEINICDYDFNFTSGMTRKIFINLQKIDYTVGTLNVGISTNTTLMGWNLYSGDTSNVSGDTDNWLYPTIFGKPNTFISGSEVYYGLTIKNEMLFDVLMKIRDNTENLHLMLITQTTGISSTTSEILGSNISTNVQDEVVLGAPSTTIDEPLLIQKPTTELPIYCEGDCPFDISCNFDGICSRDSICGLDNGSCVSDDSTVIETIINYYDININEDNINELLQGKNVNLFKK